MTQAEIALPLAEETKKVDTFVAHSVLEAKEISAKSITKWVADMDALVEEARDPEITIKAIKMAMDLLGIGAKNKDAVQGPQRTVVNFSINLDSGRPTITVDADISDADTIELNPSPAMSKFLDINAEILND